MGCGVRARSAADCGTATSSLTESAGLKSGSDLAFAERLRFRRIVRLLLLQLLLLFLREVMSDNATDRCAGHRVMAGHVSCHRADRSTFDATLCRGGLCTEEEGESEQRHGNSQPFHLYFPQHARVPFEHFAWVITGAHVATLEILLPWFRPGKPGVRAVCRRYGS